METTKGGILGRHTLKDTVDDDVKVEERKQHEHDDGRDDEMEPWTSSLLPLFVMTTLSYLAAE